LALQFFVAASARDRLDAAAAALDRLAPHATALIVGASRAAADECAFAAARRRGGLFGVTRTGFVELVTRLALPALATDHRSPISALGAEALVTRATFDAGRERQLEYFLPVAHMPGFPRAAARTLQELQLATIDARTLRRVGAAGQDLAELLDRLEAAAAAAGTAPRSAILAEATQAVRRSPGRIDATLVILLDIVLTSAAESAFVRAIADVVPSVFAVSPEGDVRTHAAYARLGAGPSTARNVHATPDRAVHQQIDLAFGDEPATSATALTRLQDHLFSLHSPPQGAPDDTVEVFSAPGEGREAVEIARRVLHEASRDVPFDEIAVLLRAPHTYLGLIEHAFARAEIPAWFERGTRRPDPAGRAFLALLACAEEHLSARRFAEYLSLGQVPVSESPADETWSAPVDELAEGVVPRLDRAEDRAPLDEAPPPEERDRDRIVAGSLQAPWRWEALLVEAYVIEGLDRWRRRLPGLRHEDERRIRELTEEEPDSPRIASLKRNVEQLRYLEDFALPIVETLDGWRDAERWSVWLDRLTRLAPRALRQPARVLRVLGELAPLGGVGPVRLSEVREVLAPRLRLLTHEPPRRRHGRVFVGTCHAARGRSFRVVFVPGLVERVFPQRLREDALLLDAPRAALDANLAVRQTRADDERLQLRLAIGAASERVYVSYPRVELRESRARVPSFYVLDVVRAMSGTVPNYSQVAEHANRQGAASLAWPAPQKPADAIDDFEHDLATLRPLLLDRLGANVAGRARYLVDLNPTLRRSVTERWARHQKRWSKADGLVTPSADTLAALSAHRLTARSYSLTALQRYSACPYQFLLAAIYRLAPLEEPAPLQRMDPLTRGSLFHEIQAAFYRTLRQNGQLPVTAARLASARQQLEWVIAKVTGDAAERLAPAIERVWIDEVASMRRDLLLWLERLPNDADWIPERFEFAFGLPPDEARDAGSVAHPAVVDGRFHLRGSVDLIERNPRTKALRVTDHKTGKNRTTRATVVHGGQVLQPVLYGLALEALTGDVVYEGRLWYCTTAGNYDEHRIQLGDSARRSGIEVLDIIDRAIEQGPLAARPAHDACRWCDFIPVCGREEELRTARKPATGVADLEALRRMP
jgi:ATP-dependent helicase/nuclease subunit B